jgi:hypothetical protein
MMCVQMVNYAILVNGNPVRQIFLTREFSPYPFFICTKALSSLLARVDQIGTLTSVPTSKKGPHLNHIFFVDDNLLFYKANKRHWQRMTNLLGMYEATSGQRLNK